MKMLPILIGNGQHLVVEATGVELSGVSVSGVILRHLSTKTRKIKTFPVSFRRPEASGGIRQGVFCGVRVRKGRGRQQSAGALNKQTGGGKTPPMGIIAHGGMETQVPRVKISALNLFTSFPAVF